MNDIFGIIAIIITFFFIFFLLRVFVKLLFAEEKSNGQYNKQAVNKSQNYPEVTGE